VELKTKGLRFTTIDDSSFRQKFSPSQANEVNRTTNAYQQSASCNWHTVEDLKQGLLVYSEGQVMMILEHYLVRVVLLVLATR
jgi:hypothetical protein